MSSSLNRWSLRGLGIASACLLLASLSAGQETATRTFDATAGVVERADQPGSPSPDPSVIAFARQPKEAPASNESKAQSPQPEKQKKLYLLLARDANDPTLPKVGEKSDLDRVQAALMKLDSEKDVSFAVDVRVTSAQTLLDSVKQLQIRQDTDSVLVYYIGRGKYDGGTYITPFDSKEGPVWGWQLVQELLTKKPHLGVVFLDCVEPVSVESPPSPPDSKEDFDGSRVKLLERQFFPPVKNTGILMVSSSPGQCGLTTAKATLFTSALWHVLCRETSNQNVTWTDFKNEVQAELSKALKQLPGYPMFEIAPGYKIKQNDQTIELAFFTTPAAAR